LAQSRVGREGLNELIEYSFEIGSFLVWMEQMMQPCHFLVLGESEAESFYIAQWVNNGVK
jgi:hypothetical protein